MSDSKSSGGGIGFVGLLAIVFITLKLLGKITWSWWWVLSPIWITAVVVITALAVAFIALYIRDRKWRRALKEMRRRGGW